MMLAGWTAQAQSLCLCENPNDPFFADSTTVEFPYYGYQCHGLKGKEWRAVNKCLGWPSRAPLVLGPEFRSKLCTCSPKRACFTRLEIVDPTERQPPVLNVYFEERQQRSNQ
ncbi:MAG: hypothetical protein ABI432_07350 [Flavobacteriales bacterium]